MKNTLDIFKFLKENIAEKTMYFKYNSKGSGTETSDSFGKRSHKYDYVYDVNGNWLAQFYINHKSKK